MAVAIADGRTLVARWVNGPIAEGSALAASETRQSLGGRRAPVTRLGMPWRERVGSLLEAVVARRGEVAGAKLLPRCEVSHFHPFAAALACEHSERAVAVTAPVKGGFDAL